MATTTRKMQNVGSSSYWNPGSTSYSSGRIPKVSIGITIDKSAKMGESENKGNHAGLPTLEIPYPPPGNLLKESTMGSGSKKENSFQFPNPGLVLETILKENMPPIMTDTSENNYIQLKSYKARTLLSASAVSSEMLAEKTFKVFVKRTSELVEDSAHRKLDTVVHGQRNLEYGQNLEEQEGSFVSIQRVKATGGKLVDEPHKIAGENREALRMRLWEVLGAASSQRNPAAESPTFDGLPEDANGDLNSKVPTAESGKPKQNSDTIEPDTESPLQKATTRPLTRSLSRKSRITKSVVYKPQHENKSGKRKLSSCAGSKLKKKGENIFIFDGAVSEAKHPKCPVRGQSSGSSRKRVEKRGSLESGEAQIPAHVKMAHSNKKEHALSSAETASIRCKGAESSSSRSKLKKQEENIFVFDEAVGVAKCLNCSARGQSSSPSRKRIDKEESFDSKEAQSPVRPKTAQAKKKEHTLASSEMASKRSKCTDYPHQPTRTNDHSLASKRVHEIKHTVGNPRSPFKKPASKVQESSGTSIPKRKKHPWEGLENSLFGKLDVVNDIPSPTLAPSKTPCSKASEMHWMADLSPEIVGPTFPVRKLFHPRSSDNSAEESHGSDAATKSSDDSGENYRLRGNGFRHVDEKGDIEERQSLSQNEEQDTESSEADHFRGFLKTDGAFSSGRHSKSKPFSLHNNKRIHGFEDVKINKTKLPSPSSKVLKEPTLRAEAKMQNTTDDCLTSSAVELAKFLHSFKGKMSSHTSKKSSEILESTAENLRLKLQGLESQIQAGVGKLNNASKTKRKRFESIIEEQQARLVAIHERFKHEVHQHLVEFKTVLEELEAHHLELKGSVERQKASHKKLLAQAQEEMKLQLGEAEKSIAAVRKEASKKMKGIKHVLDEWISEDIS